MLPRILIVNDDGFYSEGIIRLASYLKERATVLLVAPFLESSACGHGITLDRPIQCRQVSKKRNLVCYAVHGTPVDCVKFAFAKLYDSPPDLIISGINIGLNLGVDIVYSGTVAGAVEASIQGVPAIAVSIESEEKILFETVFSFLNVFLDAIGHGKKCDSSLLLNINIPNVPSKNIRDIVLSTQGKSRFRSEFELNRTLKGVSYYWMLGQKETLDKDHLSDETLFNKNTITMTSLNYDFTDYDSLDFSRSNRDKTFSLKKIIDLTKKKFFQNLL